ncbi:peptidoglycan synthetase [Poseidonibacter sp.]|uniref:peptidoglycan synthetase n=1 Tax=Poseidonibacter sp. TaxID=2321188 RepID=UPI003C785833
MQITSILDIIDGRLLNQPSISYIYSLKMIASKVREGDLFIARDLDDISLAVQNGAFAIIVDKIYPIIDKEIAWIRVDNIDRCLVQLLRYKLAHFNLEAYYCEKVSYDLLKIFSSSSNKNIKVIPNSLDYFIKYINDIEDADILICNDKKLLDKLYPNNKEFIVNNYKIENLIEHSLFEVSFSYKDNYFPKLKISTIYINNFLSVYEFLESTLEYSRLKYFNHLKPIFLDKNMNLTDFGKSDKFIISQNTKNLLKDEIAFLKEKFSYAKTIFLTSKYINELDNQQILIEDINDIKKELKKHSFNAAYIVGFEFNELSKNLIKLEKELTLF